ncbi:MAG: FAD-binding protein, partial [Chloroflexota bacterium]
MTELTIKGNIFDLTKMSSADYYEALMSTLFNQRTLTQKPDLMVQPKDVDDVIATVNYARSIGKKLSICSGGHSWSSNHMRDDSILLDMHYFNTFEINREASTV